MPEWVLPDSPTHPHYAELYREVKGNRNRAEAYNTLRRVVEVDFWAFCRFVSSFGQYRIRDKGHANLGGLWVERTASGDWRVGERVHLLSQDHETVPGQI